MRPAKGCHSRKGDLRKEQDMVPGIRFFIHSFQNPFLLLPFVPGLTPRPPRCLPPQYPPTPHRKMAKVQFKQRVLTPDSHITAGTGNRTQIEGGSHDDSQEEEHHKPTCYHYTIPAFFVSVPAILLNKSLKSKLIGRKERSRGSRQPQTMIHDRHARPLGISLASDVKHLRSPKLYEQATQLLIR